MQSEGLNIHSNCEDRGSKLPWSHASEGSLMELVRNRRYLWDRRNQLYSKTKVKQGAFNAVAEELLAEFGGKIRLDSCDQKLALSCQNKKLLH
ncbi:hypothetical protein E2C01_071917 [Portunus trituberculatus]|uniref:MADF domain-containing protein n=1 Tax=Portunus trituberculatus TaxID=210409 RepID=A0A5B7I556_PORTR|nr:hypothetical protein [Portunus trituberculatus]